MIHLKTVSGMHRQSWLYVLIMLLFLLVPINSAIGQGMFGILPGPITNDDLDEYADRLGMSDEQLLAAAEFHSQYLSMFREFQQREVDVFLEQLRENAPRRFSPDAAATIKEATDEVERLMRRIRQLDEQFFSRMSEVLTQQQRQIMPRIQMQRERARYDTQITQGFRFWINAGAVVDLSEMVRSLDLPPETLERIDPLLSDYEQRLTRSANNLFHKGVESVRDIAGQLEELGFSEETFRNPRQIGEFMQVMQELWEEHVQSLLNETASLASYQRRSYRQFADVLPDDAAHQLRRSYFREAYRDAVSIGRRAERQFAAALEIEDLSSSLRNSIEVMEYSHRHEQHRRADRIADLLDEIRKDRSIEQFMRRDDDPRQKRIEELQEEAEQADHAIIDSLHAMLGPDRVEAMSEGAGDDDARGRFRAARDGRRGPGMRRGGPQGGSGWGGLGGAPSSRNLPGPITTGDIGRYIRMLSLDNDAASLLESLHDDYVARFEEVKRDYFEPLDEISGTLRSDRDSDDDDAVADGAVQRTADAFRTAFGAIHDLDQSLFNDMKIVIQSEGGDVLQEQIERLRLARERQTYRVSTAGVNAGPWTRRAANESDIDLRRLARDLPAQLRLADAFDSRLAAYERELTDLQRKRFETDLDLGFTTLDLRLSMRHASGTDRRQRWREMNRVVRNVADRSADVHQDITLLNRNALDALLSHLPDSYGRSLRDKYHREAFPSVFDDDSAVQQMLGPALELPGLSDSQQSRLRDLAMEYRANYAELSADMVNVYLAFDPSSGDRRGRGGLSREDRNTIDRLRFERDELNRLAERRIRAILSPSQLDRIERPHEEHSGE